MGSWVGDDEGWGVDDYYGFDSDDEGWNDEWWVLGCLLRVVGCIIDLYDRFDGAVFSY